MSIYGHESPRIAARGLTAGTSLRSAEGVFLPRAAGLRAKLALDVLGDHVHREQVADPGQFRVPLELAQVGERHALAQFRQALVGDLAVLHELGVALEDGFREELAARNLDAELAL